MLLQNLKVFKLVDSYAEKVTIESVTKVDIKEHFNILNYFTHISVDHFGLNILRLIKFVIIPFLNINNHFGFVDDD